MYAINSLSILSITVDIPTPPIIATRVYDTYSPRPTSWTVKPTRSTRVYVVLPQMNPPPLNYQPPYCLTPHYQLTHLRNAAILVDCAIYALFGNCLLCYYIGCRIIVVFVVCRCSVFIISPDILLLCCSLLSPYCSY
jgi:hypothetical protein